MWMCEIDAIRYASRVLRESSRVFIDRTKDMLLLRRTSMFSAALELWDVRQFFCLKPRNVWEDKLAKI